MLESLFVLCGRFYPRDDQEEQISLKSSSMVIIKMALATAQFLGAMRKVLTGKVLTRKVLKVLKHQVSPEGQL